MISTAPSVYADQLEVKHNGFSYNIKYDSSRIAETNYDYQVTNVNTKSPVSKITNNVKNFVSTTDQQTKSTYSFAYEYDNNNNITHEYSVDANGAKTLRYHYTYDEANQLVRVDDNVQGKTYKYLYNKGGNRIQTKTYPYTFGTDLGTETSSVLQSHLDLVWHDGMTSYDGKMISYDALGNSISYNGTSLFVMAKSGTISAATASFGGVASCV